MAKLNNNSESKKIRRIAMVLIAIFILLLTIRSCSTEFNWTIGKLFGTESHHEINEENKNKEEVILNKNLYFDMKEDSISLDVSEYKISFSYKTINPEEFTCSTSDATIATCYVKDNYVVVNPKGIGEVTIYVQTKTNNKIYKASMKLNITEGTGIAIFLIRWKSMIYLTIFFGILFKAKSRGTVVRTSAYISVYWVSV